MQRLDISIAPDRHAWRPGPPTPYPLLPATRRLEWLAFVATPIGGIMAVVDSGSAGGICAALLLVALIIGIPCGIQEMLHRLPTPAARVLDYTLAGLAGLCILGLVAIGVAAAVTAPR